MRPLVHQDTVGELKQRDGNQIEYSPDLQKAIVEDVKAPCKWETSGKFVYGIIRYIWQWINWDWL